MPFTPFHFGPGVFFKSVMFRQYSLSVFVFTQILIDLESGYHLFRQEWPVHRFLHTFPGATLIAGVAVFAGPPVCRRVMEKWNRINKKDPALQLDTHITRRQAVWGAFIGAYSHVILDGVMHQDVAPFAPLSDANFLHGLVNMGLLHLICLIAGGVGLIALGFRKLAGGNVSSEK